LWKDARRNGRINLARFYFRRTLRIFPPFYAYLAVVAIGGVVGLWTIPASARWWPAVLFVGNVVNTNDWLVGHAWSLALEEQYYLAWPIALAYFIRRRGKVAGVQMGTKIVIGTLCLLPLVRVAVFAATRSGALVTGLMFDFVAAGSGMALLQETDFFERQRAALAVRFGRALPYTGLLALLLHLVFAGSHRWMFAVDVVFSTTAEAVLLAIFLGWATRHPEHWMGRVLNVRPLRIVGIASYSLYLYQQLFFEEAAPFHLPVPVGLALLCGCAALSYWLVEAPSLRFRIWAERWIWPPNRGANHQRSELAS
jgi:peptidoglycan/LPS O-acetylase OafA/YrhL